MKSVSEGPLAATDVILAVDARSSTERRLIERWASGRTVRPAGAVVDGEDDVVVTPVRVTWALRPDPDGPVTDVLALAAPRRPPAPLQRVLRGQAELTVGESATLGELRARFAAGTDGASAEAFATFVRVQAVLACDRAERRMLGDRYKVPRLVAEQLAVSPQFRQRVERLSHELGRPVDAVRAEAEACLHELATVQSPVGLEFYRRTTRPMYAHAWDVETDTAGFAELRELNRRHALVFLPSHRSYADPLLLREALHRADVAPPHVLGGENLGFWPAGPIGKRMGAIFIRRDFGTDGVYKLAVREFFGHLAAKRLNLEWYMEGGRTRTGKLRTPKVGLLHYLARAVEEDEAIGDPLLVPVSIVYDRLVEVTHTAAEQTGGAKRQEDLRWLWDYVRAQRRPVGSARVDVGEPLSLRNALRDAGTGRTRLPKVAFRVADAINGATPLTTTSVVAYALLDQRDRALTLDEVGAAVRPLLDHARTRGLPGDLDHLGASSGLRRGLELLVESGAVACHDAGTEPVWTIAPGGHHVAAFYRNGMLHHLLHRAIAELALRGAGDPSDRALALRELLKFEFFFAGRQQFERVIAEELEQVDPHRPLVAHGTLRSFLDAQLVVAERLVEHDPHVVVDRTPFLAECLAVGRQRLLQRQLHGAESVSRELFTGALRLAAHRDLVDARGGDVRTARRALLDEIRAFLDDLASTVPPRPREAAHA